jgi:hypothetical protein
MSRWDILVDHNTTLFYTLCDDVSAFLHLVPISFGSFFHLANSIFDGPVSEIKFENENRREVIPTYLVRFHPYKYVMFYVEFSLEWVVVNLDPIVTLY